MSWSRLDISNTLGRHFLSASVAVANVAAPKSQEIWLEVGCNNWVPWRTWISSNQLRLKAFGMLGFDGVFLMECMAKWTHKRCWVELSLAYLLAETESHSVSGMIGTVANAGWYHPP